MTGSRPALILIALWLLLGPGARQAHAEELLVSAAISLREAFSKIGKDFEAANPGAKVVFNFAGSGALSAQIEQGAPVDVFASAAQDRVERLVAKGLVGQQDVRKFARNLLVVVVPTGGQPVLRLKDLEKVRRLAIGNPATVPAGQYGMEALKKAGVFDAIDRSHHLVFAESVRQVLTYVDSSNADAGIVYSSDARMGKSVLVTLTIAPDLSDPIVYPITTLKDSKHLELGRKFVDLVVSRPGQDILRKYGFLSAAP